MILAGGLTPENVELAMAHVRPYGVDVSSGAERAPGVKDHRKVRQFIARASRSALDETGLFCATPVSEGRMCSEDEECCDH